jgi:hypothetical protein
VNERIKELAEQSGLEWVEMMQTWLANDAEIERFVELVRQDEREACIEIVTKNASLETAWKCEEEIRARGNT